MSVYPKHNDVTELIVLLAKLYKPNIYIEFGTQRGYTFNKVLPYVNHIAYSVDKTNYREIQDSNKVVKFIGTTKDFYDEYGSHPCLADMIFIDAAHDIDSVTGDISYARQLIQIGTGLILVHDTYPVSDELKSPKYCHDAWKAAMYLKDHCVRWREYRHLEVLTLPGPYYGLTILREVSAGCHFK